LNSKLFLLILLLKKSCPSKPFSRYLADNKNASAEFKVTWINCLTGNPSSGTYYCKKVRIDPSFLGVEWFNPKQNKKRKSTWLTHKSGGRGASSFPGCQGDSSLSIKKIKASKKRVVCLMLETTFSAEEALRG
jgi:hypothetical protein